MSFFQRVIGLFYVLLVLFLTCSFGLFLLHKISFDQAITFIYLIYSDEQLRIIFGSATGLLLVVNFAFFKLFTRNSKKEKIIAFDNPSGRVSVALTALEDLVKRMTVKLSEVRDVKSSITTSKKGLKIKIRLVLCSEVNIPEVTSRVQDSVKKKIQDTIGLDEAVDIAIYVGKIVPEPSKKEKQQDKVEPKQENLEPNIPFQGYRA